MVLEWLHALLIEPLVYLLETVFTFAHHITVSAGASIIILSVVVNVFCLPLYQKADELQRLEREKRQDMEPWIQHIKATFHGDERFMMLSAYYSIVGYRSTEVIYSALPLLFQVPFFIAAYSFLSTLRMLEGVSFFGLADLSQPDGMLTVGSSAYNLLPIAMTLLNCLSVALYTKDAPLRDKLQAYGLAIVFLVLLYDSPAGLVLYWTCNQLLSLLKNACLIYVPDQKLGRMLLGQAYGAVLVLAVISSGVLYGVALIAEATALVIVYAALWAYYLLDHRKDASSSAETDEVKPNDPMEDGASSVHDETVYQQEAATGRQPHDNSRRMPKLKGAKLNVSDLLARVEVPRKTATTQFFLAMAALSLLLGLLIPSATIAASPTEFVDLRHLLNPVSYLVRATLTWVGTLMVWVGTFFLLSSDKGRSRFVLAGWCLLGVFLLGYFLGNDYGTISNELRFEDAPVVNPVDSLKSMLAAFASVFVFAFVWVRINKALIPAMSILAITLTALAVPNVAAANRGYDDVMAKRAEAASAVYDTNGSIAKRMSLSRSERNVVVLFLDRAISGYVPYIFHERPELAQSFDGFRYYPNTISFGYSTVFGSPSIYGGYEYTPSAMNERSDELCVDKHNEALRVLPEILSREGWTSYQVNPAYANYQWVMDASVFEGMENVRALDLSGVYADLVSERHGIVEEVDLNRRFFYYGLFKALPASLQPVVYDDGEYLSAATTRTITSSFMNEYSVLEVLPDICGVDGGSGSLILLHNEATHEPQLLQLPDYLPAGMIENEGLDDPSRFTLGDESVIMDQPTHAEHYHVNAAAYLRLATWFDWMRDQDVYDNTRIIIVSDHGKSLGQWPELIKDDVLDIEGVNAVLMVKDFDAHGFETSDEFMTTADVPVMALEGVVDNPVNPYTGVPITDNDKHAHDQLVTTSWHWHTEDHPGTVFDTSDHPWYTVHDNIFDLDNWQRVDEGEGT